MGTFNIFLLYHLNIYLQEWKYYIYLYLMKSCIEPQWQNFIDYKWKFIHF